MENKNNENLIDEFLSCKTFVVAGSFRNEEKTAFQVFRRLIKAGKTVYPVTRAAAEADGVKAYKDLKEIQAEIDVVNLVTPPAVSLKTAKQCLELGIKKIWFQPGAQDDEVLRFCGDNGIKTLYGVCVLIEAQ
ncbi:MAG: CoA-binding protein [Candidatus Goldiibacteriota bacterium]